MDLVDDRPSVVGTFHNLSVYEFSTSHELNFNLNYSKHTGNAVNYGEQIICTWFIHERWN